MDELTITINEQGETTVAVKGVKGSSCQDVSKDIERALGKVTNDHKTSEYYERDERNIARNRA